MASGLRGTSSTSDGGPRNAIHPRSGAPARSIEPAHEARARARRAAGRADRGRRGRRVRDAGEPGARVGGDAALGPRGGPGARAAGDAAGVRGDPRSRDRDEAVRRAHRGGGAADPRARALRAGVGDALGVAALPHRGGARDGAPRAAAARAGGPPGPDHRAVRDGVLVPPGAQRDRATAPAGAPRAGRACGRRVAHPRVHPRARVRGQPRPAPPVRAVARDDLPRAAAAGRGGLWSWSAAGAPRVTSPPDPWASRAARAAW